MLLDQNFLSNKPLQMMNFQLILAMMISPCAMITFVTKYLNKLIYTLVNLILNTLQKLLNFYFWFLTVIHIMRVYFVQSEISICTDGRHNLACYEWGPAKSILAPAKSATHKNLWRRKKQQQQATVNEDSEDRIF